MDIDEILIWYILVATLYEVLYHLLQVWEGEHEHKIKPPVQAGAAVFSMAFLLLWYFYVIKGV